MYWYRCNRRKCRTRVSFRRPIETYKKEKRCWCGGKLHSTHFDKERLKKLTCTCDGLPFPHQLASKWCNYYTGEYTEEDMRERYGRA